MVGLLLATQAACRADEIAVVAELSPAGQVALFVFASVLAACLAVVLVAFIRECL